MTRTTTTRLAPALLAATAALALAWALPAGADAMGTMTGRASYRYVPETICRQNVTCLAQWHVTVPLSVPLSPGETVAPGHRVVMDVYGDDPVSDDHLLTVAIPFRESAPKAATCSDGAVAESFFIRSGSSLLIRGCFRSVRRYGPFNEDRGILDEGDELLFKVRLVDGGGATVRSANVRTLGRF